MMASTVKTLNQAYSAHRRATPRLDALAGSSAIASLVTCVSRSGGRREKATAPVSRKARIQSDGSRRPRVRPCEAPLGVPGDVSGPASDGECAFELPPGVGSASGPVGL